MPKTKTSSSVKKRFKVTGTRQAPAAPGDEEPQPDEEDVEAEARASARTTPVDEQNVRRVKQMLGRKGGTR